MTREQAEMFVRVTASEREQFERLSAEFPDPVQAAAAYFAGSATVHHEIAMHPADWLSYLPADARHHLLRVGIDVDCR